MSNDSFVIGVDEAGRGAWAGPVCAAAFVFLVKNPKKLPFYSLLADSKTLSEKRREELFDVLVSAREKGLVAFGVSLQDSNMIDTVGIRESNRLAMAESLGSILPLLSEKEVLVKIDGRDNYHFDGISKECVEFIVRGDSKIREIMGASIVAKVTRDRLMREYALQYSDYGFAASKGYGTRAHEAAIRALGILPIHRKTFEPMKSL